MLFKKRIHRVVDVKKAEDKFRDTLKEEPLEKGDIPAMMLAAALVILPILILLVLIILGISWLFVGRFT